MNQAVKILFIDDDATMRRAFARTLRSMEGVELDVADGSVSALEFAKTTHYAAIATDLGLGEESGLDLVDKLWHLQPDATMILISGQLDLDVALMAINEHNISFLLKKPWDTHELLSIVQRGADAHWERVTQRQVQQNMVSVSQDVMRERAKLREAVQQGGRAATDALLKVVHVRGHETLEHCHRVAGYSLLLAQRMGLMGEALSDIERGALLHDIGLMVVPDEILFKHGPLTPQEWEVMKAHPKRGAEMLDGVTDFAKAREVVMQHHERFDGTGYPEGIKGNAISVGARIFSVSDSIEAMTTDRQYRKAVTMLAAVEEVAKHAGTWYDPLVIEALRKVAVTDLEAVQFSRPRS